MLKTINWKKGLRWVGYIIMMFAAKRCYTISWLSMEMDISFGTLYRSATIIEWTGFPYISESQHYLIRIPCSAQCLPKYEFTVDHRDRTDCERTYPPALHEYASNKDYNCIEIETYNEPERSIIWAIPKDKQGPVYIGGSWYFPSLL